MGSSINTQSSARVSQSDTHTSAIPSQWNGIGIRCSSKLWRTIAYHYSVAPLTNKRPHCVTSDTPRFVSILCLRSKYVGEISGLLSVLDEDEKMGLADRLVKGVWDACRERSDSKHRGALWRATAYLIICSGINRKLLHAVCKFQSIQQINLKLKKLFAPKRHHR